MKQKAAMLKRGGSFARSLLLERIAPRISCLRQFVLLDLSIVNFSIVLGRAAARHAIGAKQPSRSHDAVIRVYDEAGKVIETHEHAGDFQKP